MRTVITATVSALLWAWISSWGLDSIRHHMSQDLRTVAVCFSTVMMCLSLVVMLRANCKARPVVPRDRQPWQVVRKKDLVSIAELKDNLTTATPPVQQSFTSEGTIKR